MRLRGSPHPLSRFPYERLRMVRPIVESRRIEIGSIRPHEGVDFRVDVHLTKQLRVSERTVQRTDENRLEVDRALELVVERDAYDVRPNDLDRAYSMNRVGHPGSH